MPPLRRAANSRYWSKTSMAGLLPGHRLLEVADPQYAFSTKSISPAKNSSIISTTGLDVLAACPSCHCVRLRRPAV